MNDLKQQMGKTTSSGFKNRTSTKDTSKLSITAQKWSSEPLISSRTDMITNNIDNLVDVMQIKGLDVNLHKNIETGVHKNEVLVDKVHNYIDDKSFNDFTEDTRSLTDNDFQCRKEISFVIICAAVVLDHSYSLSSYQLQQPSYDDDEDIDCGNSSQSEDTDQHCHKLSYVEQGVDERLTVSNMDLDKKLNNFCANQSPSSSSVSSLTADINSRSSLSFLSDDQNSDIGNGINSPESPVFDRSYFGKSPKADDKFKAHSFKFSNIQLEKLANHNDCATRHKRFDSNDSFDHQISSFSMRSPSASSNIHSLLQSPTPDWDRSEANLEMQDDSSDSKTTPNRLSPYFTDTVMEWTHSMFHDHDYYAKDTETTIFVDNLRKYRKGKRKNALKSKLDRISHEKIMKGKYLKKELLKIDGLASSSSAVDPVSVDSTLMKTNPVGRPRKRTHDKIVDDIDPETGSKLKITGKFKDQYVYYLSKSSRTTSRGRQTISPSLVSDKIIVPAPNPGDIIIPHLTDADIEALRLKRCITHNPIENPNFLSVSSNPLPTQSSISSNESDVDSHIVSTILSMESDSIASTEIQETTDIINTSELNPNQPALTESLRLISGDPHITSEHVLNYLLSMVKDEGLLGSEPGFNNSSSAVFQTGSNDNRIVNVTESENPVCENISLLSHSISSRQDTLDTTNSMEVSTSLLNQPMLNDNVQNADKFSDTHKYFIDENVNLPDDLSSFLTESKGAVSSSAITGYSNSLMKSTFDSNLGLLEIPQSSSPVNRLTSIKRTLDYLGAKDEDMKFDNHVFNSKAHHTTDLVQELNPMLSSFSDDTPWIVTITLYFNDVPAIMMNNQPHIRLVDIHKQILPAKDTGILKKRCQLLKIPVLCCTEMQRYFLVQYGKAYNSKSTLIISKDNATNLVTYYATPQPRMARTIEIHDNNSGGSKHLNMKLPVSHVPPEVIKNGIKGSRKASDLLSLPSSKGHKESVVKQPEQKDKSQQIEASTVSHGNRTRHKKINYLDLLKGGDKDKPSCSANVESTNSMINLNPYQVPVSRPFKLTVPNMLKAPFSSSSNKDVLSKKKSPFHQKRNRGMEATVIQSVGVNRAEKQIKHYDKVEQGVYVCSEIDSDGCVDLLQTKKCRPIKLKVKSLLNIVRQQKDFSHDKHSLFSCSNPTTTEKSSRVLSVVHQSAKSAESSLPSQAADIHIDLFIKSNSACVRCSTCNQFLSVPHFMRHHHVPLDSDCLATEAAQRILVPRNKENISYQEQQLWAEFHRLQEAIGGFGEADDETDSDESEDQCSLDLSTSENIDTVALKFPKISIPSSHINVEEELPVEDKATKTGLSCTNFDSVKDYKNDSFSLFKYLSTTSELLLHNCHKLSNNALPDTGSVQQNVTNNNSQLSDVAQQTFIDSRSSITRTSTRKRKSKQFFSIENYYTPKKWTIGEELISHKHVRT